uniref:Ig-like domain-containing protein n=1 Tax=Equus caballus TaxID=9796 RepID=A0A9L0TBM3_HORSE
MPKPAMGSTLFCWVVIWLLGAAGLGLGALVSQHPSKAICMNGTSVKIECRAMDFQAQTMFWYRQLPKQGLTLMVASSDNSSITYEQGFTRAKFPINHLNRTFSTLTVMSVHPADSGLYFCSASDTVLGRSQRPKQDPLQQPPLSHPTKPLEPCGRRCRERKTTASL